jgi:hypothetical protein
MQRKVRMLELTIYGLTRQAAMLPLAGLFAYADEFSSPREEFSFSQIKDARLNDPQMIETETPNRRVQGTVGTHG